MHYFVKIAFGFTAMLFLSACDNENTPQQGEAVRAIKPFYVSEPVGGDIRQFSGSIEAADVSALSFNVSGSVITVLVSAGESVTKDQILATLDPEPFNIDVISAEAQLKSARATVENKEADLERQKELFAKGWVTKAAFDQVQLAYDSARNEVTLAQSRLNSAIRNHKNATLRAPFEGVIAERSIEPFTEIATGQTAFLINSQGALEVTILVPAKLISRLAIGQPVSVSSNSVSSCGCEARITEIGSAAEVTNAVAVKATLYDPPAALLPGTAAEATIALAGQDSNRGYLVPLVAISPAQASGGAFVFKYVEETGTVKKVQIKGTAGRDNLIAVTQGVEPGDILAAAGVSFLRDGQKVKLLNNRANP
ncbi:efflux RND transporter periplasmic adaptor subunit [Emcibacter sp.]|uniref:efflux RND transporter periplasmic adaptor subunit n=1 Tax=Emcibacter sp. TaxID=1979954 RepID=UPI003A8D6E1D